MGIRNVSVDPILQRVCGEFLEMPGLLLTCKQAQRLWGLDEQTCRGLLDYLVEAKFLYKPVQGAYKRLTEGRTECPCRMINAHIGRSWSSARKDVA